MGFPSDAQLSSPTGSFTGQVIVVDLSELDSKSSEDFQGSKWLENKSLVSHWFDVESKHLNRRTHQIDSSKEQEGMARPCQRSQETRQQTKTQVTIPRYSSFVRCCFGTVRRLFCKPPRNKQSTQTLRLRPPERPVPLSPDFRPISATSSPPQKNKRLGSAHWPKEQKASASRHVSSDHLL